MTTVYELMAHLRVQNHISPELLKIEQSMGRIIAAFAAGTSGFRNWGVAAKGFGAILAGGEVLGVVVKVVKEISKVQHELVMLKNLGGPMAAMVDNGEITKRAYDISKISNLPLEHTLKIPGEIHSLVDSPMSAEESMKAWPFVAKYAFNQWMSKGGKGDPIEGIRPMIKGLDALGRIQNPDGSISAERLQKALNQITQVEALTHRMVNESTLFGMGQQLGGYGRGLDDQGFLTALYVAQIIGGRRAGTAGISMWQQLGAGIMTRQKARGLEEMGILAPGDWHPQMRGGGVEVTEAGLKKSLEYWSHDWMGLAQKLRDEFARKGITDINEQLRIISQTFGRQTTQRLATELVISYLQLDKERKMTPQAAGVDQANKNWMAGDIGANLQALESAWGRLVFALGGENGQMVIGFLQGVTSRLNDMTEAVRRMDPNLLSLLGKGLLALAGALVFGGMVAVIAAIGPLGWIAGGLAALAGLNWDRLKFGLGGLVEKIQALNRLVAGGATSPGVDAGNGKVRILPWIKGYLDGLMGLDHPELNPDALTPATPLGKGSIRQQPQFLGLDHGWSPTSFNPGIDNKQILQPVMIKLDLDGRLLGQAVADILEDLFTHDMQAPFANRRASYSGPGQVQTG